MAESKKQEPLLVRGVGGDAPWSRYAPPDAQREAAPIAFEDVDENEVAAVLRDVWRRAGASDESEDEALAEVAREDRSNNNAKASAGRRMCRRRRPSWKRTRADGDERWLHGPWIITKSQDHTWKM